MNNKKGGFKFMNKDFHYYGTYAAAIMAGFDRDAAEVIAWAAEMVDEVTSDVAEDMKTNYGISMPVQTMESFFEMGMDEFSFTSQEMSSKTLHKIRKIWVPFHFLPGNLNTLTQDEITVGGNDREIRDFRCLCIPNSELVRKMIGQEHTFNDITRYKDANEDILISIGLRMHVLADTWAHQNFEGSLNSYINNVDEVKMLNADFWELRTLDIRSKYSVSYLGHGRLGHKPDYPYLEYQYKAPWKKEEIYVNNPERFKQAFCQMVAAMEAIIANRKEFVISVDPQDRIPDTVKPYLENISELLKTKKDDQSEEWKMFIASNLHNTVPEDFKVYHNDEVIRKRRLNCFNKAALLHREMVIEYINERVPDFFKDL
jgi:hypothetical protein